MIYPWPTTQLMDGPLVQVQNNFVTNINMNYIISRFMYNSIQFDLCSSLKSYCLTRGRP